jgi:dethiobiotin synthetase
MSIFFITGIGTGVGKTFASAILTAGLNACYWKPIQAGTAPHTDFDWVRQVLELSSERIVPPKYLLQLPESPHSAAAYEGINIEFMDLPQINENLIIEGAGGILVPLNNNTLYIDQVQRWNIPVIIVSDGYLGTINHTLLTIEALYHRNIPIHGILFNRVQNISAKDFILYYSGIKDLGTLPNTTPQTPADYLQLYHEHICL